MSRSQPPPVSLVQIQVGGETYPLRSVFQCRTCQSQDRLFIESELVRGRSYKTIAGSLEGERKPSADSISEHVKRGHMPVPAAAQRRIIERRAKEMGRSIEASEEPLTDYLTLNEMIVHRGVEMIAEGTLDLTATDVINASKFLYQAEQAAGGDIDVQAWIEAVMVYMEVAQRYIPPERWSAYAAELQRHPVLRSLTDRASGTVPGEVVAAEQHPAPPTSLNGHRPVA